MEWLTETIEHYKIPIGPWMESFFDFLTNNFAWFFDGLSDLLNFFIEGLTELLLFCPPLVLIALIAAFASGSTARCGSPSGSSSSSC